MTRKRRRHTPDQIIRKLAEGQKLLASGRELDDVCRHLEVAESTWHRWLAQYGGMKANDAKRLKQLEVENTRLKKLLAEAELDKAMLKEIAEGNFRPRTVAVAPSRCCAGGSGCRNGEPVRSPGSIAPPSDSTRQSRRRRSGSCGRGCEPSRSGARGGVGGGRPRPLAGRGGW